MYIASVTPYTVPDCTAQTTHKQFVPTQCTAMLHMSLKLQRFKTLDDLIANRG